MELDLSGVVAGVVLAIITGTLIPFATTQFSAWSDARRQLQTERRKSLSAYREHCQANTAAVDRATRAAVAGEDYKGEFGEWADKNRQLAGRVQSSMGILDSDVSKLVDAMNVGTAHEWSILASWANGHVWWARLFARQAVKRRAHKTASSG